MVLEGTSIIIGVVENTTPVNSRAEELRVSLVCECMKKLRKSCMKYFCVKIRDV